MIPRDLVIEVAPGFGGRDLSLRLQMDNLGQGLGSSVRHRQENWDFGLIGARKKNQHPPPVCVGVVFYFN